MNQLRRTLSIVSAWIVLFMPTVIVAQQATTSVRGSVVDSQGAVIQGAKVDLVDPGGAPTKSAVSDDRGEYQFTQIMPGKYNIEASMTGFGEQEKLIELLVAQPATVNFSLGLSENTTVSVVAVQAALNITDATIGNAVNQETVASLPMEGRNVPDLLSLQPGVLYLGRNIDANRDSRSGVVAGARSDQMG